MFDNKQLKAMILPLFAEQFLLMLVGLSDTVIVSYAGEAAVSGVSLVNSFNTIFLNLFMALSAGGAVVVSQYIGREERGTASRAVSQLLMISTVFSAAVSIPILFWSKPLLSLMFGKVEADVMESCVVYLQISVYSYPALAIYNAGSALYRSVGQTKTIMNISIIANVLNVAGNVLGVFYFHAGAAGVAWPSLISRTFSAVAITVLCFKEHEGVRYYGSWIFRWSRELLSRMLRIAVPNGLESGLFQFVKVALSSVTALFGTYQIAANGIAQSIWSVAALVSIAMGPVFITVVGQCMGAGDKEQARYYFKKLMKITIAFAVLWNGLIVAAMPLIMRGFDVSEETYRLVIWLVLIHNIGNALFFPFADPLGKGLRAAGDIVFTTAVSLFTTIGLRLAFSVLFALIWNMGVIGIVLAMCLDWLVRGILFWLRFAGGRWERFQVIEENDGKPEKKTAKIIET